jgi:hypothetical protein
MIFLIILILAKVFPVLLILYITSLINMGFGGKGIEGLWFKNY